MIERASSELVAQGSPRFPTNKKVVIVGGVDFESSVAFCPTAACAAAARAWVRGYRDHTVKLIVNFGDCQGCPEEAPGSASAPVGGTLEWTVDDIYFISWGIGRARPLPQIYNTLGANARQWEQMARYARINGATKPFFLGTLTQQGACTETGTCRSDTENSPQAGWQQLYSRLNDPASPELKQSLLFSTDIRHTVRPS